MVIVAWDPLLSVCQIVCGTRSQLAARYVGAIIAWSTSVKAFIVSCPDGNFRFYDTSVQGGSAVIGKRYKFYSVVHSCMVCIV